MSDLAQPARSQFRPLLRAAAGCWQAARGFAEHRALAGYIARRALGRAGLEFDEHAACAISLGGLELHLRPGGGELCLYQEIFRDRVYERHPAFALRPGWCVVDGGANIGMFSLRAAQAGCARVFALEPDPQTFARLALNLERNGATAVTAIQSASGRASGRAAFRRSQVSTVGHLAQVEESAEGSAAIASSEVVVDVTTLAALFDRYAIRIAHLLKLDIEGAELEALEGARPVLDRIERIVMEYHGTERLAACERLLRQYGFARVALVPPAYAYFARGWVC
jgi:FkbM family methyltransferase